MIGRLDAVEQSPIKQNGNIINHWKELGKIIWRLNIMEIDCIFWKSRRLNVPSVEDFQNSQQQTSFLGIVSIAANVWVWKTSTFTCEGAIVDPISINDLFLETSMMKCLTTDRLNSMTL